MVRTSMRLFYFEFPIKRFLQETAKIFNRRCYTRKLKEIAICIHSSASNLPIGQNKKISNSTIKRYIDYLCDSFLLDSAIRYDVKRKKYIDTPVMYYFTDMRLRNAKLNFRQIEETHSMENIIFNELKMRGFHVDVGVIVQYGTNEKGNSIRKQLEIDFICNKGFC